MTLSDDDDLTAAEYVLGTLEGPERTAASLRRERDSDFDAAVASWEERLTALSETITEADPSPGVWDGILARLGAIDGPPPRVVPFGADARDLRRQLRRWQGVATVSTALAAALALWIGVARIIPSTQPPTELVAFLQKSGDEPAYVMAVDLGGERVAVRPIAAQAPPGRSYELWIIDPQIGAPKSLGVLDAAVTSHQVPSSVPKEVLSRATYAVTLEEAGGSKSGAPTGAPVFVGHLVAAPR